MVTVFNSLSAASVVVSAPEDPASVFASVWAVVVVAWPSLAFLALSVLQPVSAAAIVTTASIVASILFFIVLFLLFLSLFRQILLIQLFTRKQCRPAHILLRHFKIHKPLIGCPVAVHRADASRQDTI